MIEEVKVMLGNAASSFTEDQISLCLKDARAEVEAYCNRPLDNELKGIVRRIAIIKLNKMNAEGLASQSYSGVSENYIDGFPQDIINVLNRKRRIKVV